MLLNSILNSFRICWEKEFSITPDTLRNIQTYFELKFQEIIKDTLEVIRRNQMHIREIGCNSKELVGSLRVERTFAARSPRTTKLFNWWLKIMVENSLGFYL